MEYTGKYKNLADQFRADGCDEAMTSLMNIAPASQMLIFIIQGAQRQRNPCPTTPVLLLNSAGRGARSGTEYSYMIRKDRFGLIVEGKCAVCGSRIARCCD